MEHETKMRRFVLVRNEDETGISGTGVVAEGVVFWDGTCVIKWLTDTSSINIYKSYVEMIHLHGHEGRTVIEWVDERKEEKREEKQMVAPGLPVVVEGKLKDNSAEEIEELRKVAVTLAKVSEKLTEKIVHENEEENKEKGN